MHLYFFHRIDLKRMMCIVLMLMTTRGVTEELEATSTEEKDRYARVVVRVEVADNTFETRKAAISQAKEEALVLWLQSLLGTLDRSEEGYFLKRLNQYVSTTKVLKETALVSGGELEVEVVLDTHTLRFDAASLLFPKRTTPVPTLLIFGEYTAGGQGYSAGQDDIAPRMLRSLFTNSGFEVYSAVEVAQYFSHDDLLGCLQGGVKAATRLGRALNAEVVILGETKSVVEELDAAGPGTIRGTSDVRVIRVSDGQLLERIKTNAEVEGTDIHAAGLMAIEDAVYKAQNRVLVAAALGCLKAPERAWVRLKIQGKNVRNVSDSLTEYLEGLALIQSVELLHRKRDELVFSVNFQGKTSAFVNKLTDESQGGVRLDPVNIVNDEMIFHLVGY